MKEIFQEFKKGMTPVVKLIAQKCGGAKVLKIILAAVAALIIVLIVLGATTCSCTCTACDNSGNAEKENIVLEIPDVSQDGSASQTDVPKEVTFEKIKSGDTIALDFLEVKIDKIGNGERIKEGSTSLSPAGDNVRYFWLKINMKSLAGSARELYNSTIAEFVFDDKYTYEGTVYAFGGFDLEPLVEYPVYIYCEVPPELLDTYKDVKVRFGFTEDLAEYDYEKFNYVTKIDYFDYRYEFSNNPEGGEDAAEEATQPENTVQTITAGQTITTGDYDFTLNKVELIYELKPSNTSGVYSSYEADPGKVFIHVDGKYYNKSKRDVNIGSLPIPHADYNNGYAYDGFVVIDDGDNSFDWVSSYTACTPLESCHYHGLIQCPEVVDESTDPLYITITLADGNTYRYDIRA